MIPTTPFDNGTQPVRILISDDHLPLRETWNYILNKDERFSVTAACGSGQEAVALAKSLCPDVVILDISLPGMRSLETAEQIRKAAPGAQILCVSLHSLPNLAHTMLQKGAMGYVLKNTTREEMFTAILEIRAGRKYRCPEMLEAVTEHQPEATPAPAVVRAKPKRKVLAAQAAR